MRVAEFFATLGFKTDNKGMESFEGALKGLKQNMIGVKELILGGMIYGMGRFVQSSTQAADGMYDFNLQTGLSIQKLQQWQSAASIFGISAEEVRGSVQGLQSQLTQLQKLGGGDINPFSRLGIDITGKNAFDVLEELRKVAPLYDRDYVNSLISQMGITPSMLSPISMNQGEFQTLGRLNIRSDEVIKENFKLGASIRLLGEKFKYTKDVFVAEFSPQLQRVVKHLSAFGDTIFRVLGKFIRFFEKNPEILEGINDFVTNFTAGLNLIIDTITDIGRTLFKWWSDRTDKKEESIKPFGKLKESEAVQAGLKNAPEWVLRLFKFLGGEEWKTNQTKDDLRLLRMLPDYLNSGKMLAPSVNNNYYINSTANAKEIADMVTKSQEEQLQKIWNYGTTDNNNSGY